MLRNRVFKVAKRSDMGNVVVITLRFGDTRNRVLRLANVHIWLVPWWIC